MNTAWTGARRLWRNCGFLAVSVLPTACLDDVSVVDHLGWRDAGTTDAAASADGRAPDAAIDPASSTTDAMTPATSDPTSTEACCPSDASAPGELDAALGNLPDTATSDEPNSPTADAQAPDGTGTTTDSDSTQDDANVEPHEAGANNGGPSDAGGAAEPALDAAMTDASTALDAAGPCSEGLDCDSSVCGLGQCPPGAACKLDADCRSENCDVNACALGYAGARCSDANDCHSETCTADECTPGFSGAVCRSNGDCYSNACGASDTCEAGAPDTPCLTAADCQSELCNTDTNVCEAVPLILQSTTPTDDKTGVAGNTNLTLTFSENVIVGTGEVAIFTANGSLFEAIPVNSARVSISGQTVTVNPNGNLAALTEYYVLIDQGAFGSLSGGQYAGLSTPGDFSFTTLL